MYFGEEFLFASLSGVISGFVFFGLPGIAVIRLLGIPIHHPSLFILLAPAIGLTTYGPFSLFTAWVFGYSSFTLLSSWFLFLLITVGFSGPTQKSSYFPITTQIGRAHV